MARPRYFVSYVEKGSHHISMPMGHPNGSVPGWKHRTALVNVHPALWAARKKNKEKVIVFWSEIPESVYQEAKEAGDED